MASAASTPATRRPRFAAIDLASSADPYPHYAHLREQGALVRGALGQWLVPRHAEAAALLRDPRLASTFPEQFVRIALGDGPASTFPGGILLTQDPPGHTHLRRFMGTMLGTTSARLLQEYISELVEELMAPALATGRCELVEELAVPLPVAVVCRVIGIPDADRAEVVPAVMSLARIFDAANLSPEERAGVDDAVAWLRTYVQRLLTPGGGAAPDSLAGHLAAAQEWPPVERQALIDSLLFLFHAGFETTMGLISNGVRALLERPDQLELLRASPGLVPGAVEEFLRFDSPIQNTIRVARESFEFGGVKIRAGRSVMLMLGAANRDERVFTDPDRLDIRRADGQHLGFGGGLHRCVGTEIARLMGRSVFTFLVTRLTVLEAGGPFTMRPHGSLRSCASLPLIVEAAPSGDGALPRRSSGEHHPEDNPEDNPRRRP